MATCLSAKAVRRHFQKSYRGCSGMTTRFGSASAPARFWTFVSARARRASVVDDEQPVVITDWSTEGVSYREESFATLLDAPLDPWKNRGDEISAFVVKVTATNASAHPAPAAVWLHVSPGEQLRVRDGVLEGIGASSVAYSKPRFRATLQ